MTLKITKIRKLIFSLRNSNVKCTCTSSYLGFRKLLGQWRHLCVCLGRARSSCVCRVSLNLPRSRADSIKICSDSGIASSTCVLANWSACSSVMRSTWVVRDRRAGSNSSISKNYSTHYCIIKKRILGQYLSTFVWLTLYSVCTNVSLCSECAAKRLAAVWALVGATGSVLQLMTLQRSVRCKRRCAFATREVLFP